MTPPTPDSPQAAWRKTHHPCSVCDEKAVGCFSPDLDIKGLCYCEDHKEEVMLAYMALTQPGDNEILESMTKDWKHK